MEKDFYGELPAPKAMAYAALRGALSSLNDPYTILVEPQPRQIEKDELHGSFGGIGVLLSQSADGSFVLLPTRDGPAMRAGIQEGDVLLAVDGTIITPQMTPGDVQVLIRGPVGSEVRLTVRRVGTPEPLVLTIVREEIVTPSVTWRMLEGQTDIGYIKITSFTERTPQELLEALTDLRSQGMARLILDLRDNGGGLLNEAVQVTSQFLDKGVVLYERGRGTEESAYPVQEGGMARDMPLVVLINGGTASASEIVAGALQDYGRGLLIGERTFGKGSVQHIYDLSDGSSLHVTSAQWFTPNRHQISGQGLTPDIELPLTEEDRAQGHDPQLERAIAYFAAQAWVTSDE
ncbi:MAG: S41 family peptidase [Anaerolineae bacterium]|nr:S41 family peptidase [Anaerolineae bacterium]MDH7472631.1 S41 family peptidase [Anaerolineae bacterium]